jgi:hypothetical protein
MGAMEYIELGCVALAAFAMAGDEALRHAPNVASIIPRLRGWWRFLPALLVSVAAVMWVSQNFALPGSHTEPQPTPVHIKDIYGQKFTDQTVPLDGYGYFNCEFSGVTFVYNGGPSRIVNPKFTGRFRVRTYDQKMMGMLTFLQATNAFDPNVIESTHFGVDPFSQPK